MITDRLSFGAPAVIITLRRGSLYGHEAAAVETAINGFLPPRTRRRDKNVHYFGPPTAARVILYDTRTPLRLPRAVVTEGRKKIVDAVRVGRSRAHRDRKSAAPPNRGYACARARQKRTGGKKKCCRRRRGGPSSTLARDRLAAAEPNTF